MATLYEQDTRKNVGESTDWEGQYHKHAEMYNAGFTYVYGSNFTLFFSEERLSEQTKMELDRYTSWKVLASMTYADAQDIRAYLRVKGYNIQLIEKF